MARVLQSLQKSLQSLAWVSDRPDFEWLYNILIIYGKGSIMFSQWPLLKCWFSLADCQPSHTSYLCRMKAPTQRKLEVSGGISPCPPGCTWGTKQPLTPALASNDELLLPAVLVLGAWPTDRVMWLILTAMSHIHRGIQKITSQLLKKSIALFCLLTTRACKMLFSRALGVTKITEEGKSVEILESQFIKEIIEGLVQLYAFAEGKIGLNTTSCWDFLTFVLSLWKPGVGDLKCCASSALKPCTRYLKSSGWKAPNWLKLIDLREPSPLNTQFHNAEFFSL